MPTALGTMPETSSVLLASGASFVPEDHTEPTYGLFSINDRRLGMYRVAEGGAAVA